MARFSSTIPGRSVPSSRVELGLRWDHWFAKSFIRGAGGTFDPKLGKAVAGLDITARWI